MQLQDFLNLGQHINIDGSKLFVIDIDNSDSIDKKTIVILNGFPAISYDYHKIILELSNYYRVVIHDHFGFGFSQLPDTYCFSLVEQADICIKLWTKLNLREFTLMGHNFGTKVAQEILFRFNANILPFKIKKVILSQNSKRIDYMNIVYIHKILKDSDFTKNREDLIEFYNKSLMNNLNQIEAIKMKNIWQEFNDFHGQKELLALSNFLEETYLYWHRWAKALKASEIPIKIFWRKDDPAIKEVAIMLASNQPKNVEFIENEKCFVIEEEPLEWIKMIMKRTNTTVFDSIRLKYKVI